MLTSGSVHAIKRAESRLMGVSTPGDLPQSMNCRDVVFDQDGYAMEGSTAPVLRSLSVKFFSSMDSGSVDV